MVKRERKSKGCLRRRLNETYTSINTLEGYNPEFVIFLCSTFNILVEESHYLVITLQIISGNINECKADDMVTMSSGWVRWGGGEVLYIRRRGCLITNVQKNEDVSINVCNCCKKKTLKNKVPKNNKKHLV